MMRSWKGWNPVPTKSELPITDTAEKISSIVTDHNDKKISSRRGGHSRGKCVNAGCVVKVSLVALFGIGLVVGLVVYFNGNASSLFNTLVHPPVAPPPASPGKTNASFHGNLTITSNDTAPSSSSMLDMNATNEEMKNRQVAVLEDLNLITQSTSLLTPGTPQHSAASWIIYNDPLQLVPSEDNNFRQRYTLAVLYFSLLGNMTKNMTSFSSGDHGLDDTWLSSRHECDWNYVECSSTTLEPSTNNNNSPPSSVNLGDFHDILTNVSTVLESSITNDKLALQHNGTVDAQKVVTSLEMDRLHLKSNEGDATYTGTIPSEITTLLQLRTLRLASNDLVGTLPVDLGRLSHLEVLDLSHNRLTGPIFPDIENLSNLRILKCEGNELTGTIPSELGNLTQLEELGLDYNLFHGIILQSLCSSLVHLNHFGANFSTSLPNVTCKCCS